MTREATTMIGVEAPPKADVGRLASNAMSLPHLVFTVLAALAPLTLIVAVTPLHFMVGGAAVPGGFIFAGIIMGLFSFGFSAMTRHVRNAGAFYAVITRGLGRLPGGGAAMLAMVAYNSLQISTYGAFAVYAAELTERLSGLSLPWWVFAAISLVAVGYLGYRGIETSSRILMIVLIAEIAVLLVLCVSVIANGGAEGPRLDILSPTYLIRPELGGMLCLVVGAFMGFESTAIFSEEAEGGSATVRRATFISVGFIAIFYAGVTFIITMAYGADNIQALAKADPVNLVVNLFGTYTSPIVVDIMSILLLFSAFAALLALHNVCNRYFYVMGREGLLPSSLARTSSRHRSPTVAGTVQSVLAAVVLLLVVGLGVDPYLGLLLWGTALGLIGIITLWTVCSLAISVFLAKAAGRHSVFETYVAPILAFFGLAAVLAVVLSDLSLLTSETGLVNWLIVLSALVAVGAGVLSAARLRQVDRAAYERMGVNSEEAA